MAASFPHLICISSQILLLFSWLSHDHCHYHHGFHTSHSFSYMYIKTTSVRSAFFFVFCQRWWNGFHRLTICLNHNVASFLTMTPPPTSSFQLVLLICIIAFQTLPFILCINWFVWFFFISSVNLSSDFKIFFVCFFLLVWCRAGR